MGFPQKRLLSAAGTNTLNKHLGNDFTRRSQELQPHRPLARPSWLLLPNPEVGLKHGSQQCDHELVSHCALASASDLSNGSNWSKHFLVTCGNDRVGEFPGSISTRICGIPTLNMWQLPLFSCWRAHTKHWFSNYLLFCVQGGVWSKHLTWSVLSRSSQPTWEQWHGKHRPKIYIITNSGECCEATE